MNVFKRVPAKPTHENLQYAQNILLANGINVSLSTCEMIYLAMTESSPELVDIPKPEVSPSSEFFDLTRDSFIDVFHRIEAIEEVLGITPKSEESCDCDECNEEDELTQLFAKMEALGIKVIHHRK